KVGHPLQRGRIEAGTHGRAEPKASWMRDHTERELGGQRSDDAGRSVPARVIDHDDLEPGEKSSLTGELTEERPDGALVVVAGNDDGKARHPLASTMETGSSWRALLSEHDSSRIEGRIGHTGRRIGCGRKAERDPRMLGTQDGKQVRAPCPLVVRQLD